MTFGTIAGPGGLVVVGGGGGGGLVVVGGGEVGRVVGTVGKTAAEVVVVVSGRVVVVDGALVVVVVDDDVEVELAGAVAAVVEEVCAVGCFFDPGTSSRISATTISTATSEMTAHMGILRGGSPSASAGFAPGGLLPVDAASMAPVPATPAAAAPNAGTTAVASGSVVAAVVGTTLVASAAPVAEGMTSVGGVVSLACRAAAARAACSVAVEMAAAPAIVGIMCSGNDSESGAGAIPTSAIGPVGAGGFSVVGSLGLLGSVDSEESRTSGCRCGAYHLPSLACHQPSPCDVSLMRPPTPPLNCQLGRLGR